jgi:multidrug transporter EmrE-like cation transporter
MGLVYNVGSTVLRGVKSIIQGQLLTENRLDSVTLLYLMAPQTAACLLPMSLFTEGTEPWFALFGSDNQSQLWFLLFISGMNACLLNLSQFVVTKVTSAVTLQVLGSVKTVAGIGVSLVWFGNPVTKLQVLGIVISMSGVVLYQQFGKKLPKEPVGYAPPGEFGLKEDAEVAPAREMSLPLAEDSDESTVKRSRMGRDPSSVTPPAQQLGQAKGAPRAFPGPA